MDGEAMSGGWLTTGDWGRIVSLPAEFETARASVRDASFASPTQLPHAPG